MSILRFDNISYQYPSEDFDIIDRLSFSVDPGSFHYNIDVRGWNARVWKSYSP